MRRILEPLPKLAALACVAIFGVSGAASLVFQVTWRRILSQEIGVDYAAVTVVVALFVSGLGCGGLLGGAIARRSLGRPRVLALCYATCEIGIAAYGFISEWLLRFIGSTTAEAGIHGLGALFAYYLGALLPATVLMGATMPLMLQIGERFIARPGANLGILYGANIAGAALGALAADFWLLELLGIRATIRTASLLDVALATLFVGLVGWRADGRSHPPVQGSTGAPVRLMLLSGVCGFVTLSLEMILFRVSAHFLQSDAYAFSIMLFLYLLMMGAGNFVFSYLGDRAPVEKVIAVATIGFFVALLAAFKARYVLALVDFDSRMLDPHGTGPGLLSDVDQMIATAVIMLPVFFVSGLFPCMVRLMTMQSAGLGHAAARVYFAFSVGNGLGAAATGLAIVPILGTIGATRLLVAVTALSMMALLRLSRRDALGLVAQPAR